MMKIRNIKFYEAGRKPGRRGRVYDVDDMDYDNHVRAGGRMTRAEFFNAKLGGRAKATTRQQGPGPLERRLARDLGENPNPPTFMQLARNEGMI